MKININSIISPMESIFKLPLLSQKWNLIFKVSPIDAFELWCWRRLLRVPWTDCKEIQPVHPKKDQSWVFIGRTDIEAKTPILWPPDAKSWLIWRLWCWERLRAEGEGDDRGWDGWMASPTQWTWVWVDYRSWWWTGRPGVLWSMDPQWAAHNRVTELNWQSKYLWECPED